MASSIFLTFGGFSFSSGGAFTWPLGTVLTEVSQSTLTLGPGGTNLPLLQFGGTTSSFPALRRDATTASLGVVLADSSNFTTVLALTYRADGAGAFFWNNKSILTSPADGQMNITNIGASAGFGFDGTTDAVMKVRTRAQTGYATLDCLGLKASGAAGASGTGTVVSQLTVVNGIVTSCTIA